MMIHLNNRTYRDYGDVFHTNFIKKDENKTLTLIYVCILKAEHVHNIMHVGSVALGSCDCSRDIKNFDSISVSSTGETLIESEFLSVYGTMMPVVLYGCETWLLTLREERRLRVSENRVLRRVIGPKRDEATGEWRKLHNEELSDLYFLPNIVRVVKSRRMRWAGHMARMGGGERCA